MKNNYLILGLIVFLVVGSIIAFAKISSLNNQLKTTNKVLQLKNQEVEYYRQDSTWRAKLEAVVADNKILMETYGEELKSIRGDIKGVKKDLRNLDKVTVIETKYIDSVEVEVAGNVPDTTFHIDRYWSDHWITFRSNHLSLKYSVRDSLRIVGYWENKLFSKPKLITEAKSFNPSMSITNFMDINIPPPPAKKFYIGPFVGYDPFRGPTIGIGIGYGLIRF